MKNFLQSLLIVFALSLCGLIAVQWVRETDLRKQIQSLTNTVQDGKESIMNLEVDVRRWQSEVKRLDGLNSFLKETQKTNENQIVLLTTDLRKATNDVERLEKTVGDYKTAVQQANDNILKQNESIKRQNEEMAKVAEERNDVVKKFNKMAADYNELAQRWNKQQEDLRAAATNAPPPPPAKK